MLNKETLVFSNGLKNDFPIYRPWAVIRIKSDWAKSAKTELSPMGGVSGSPGKTLHSSSKHSPENISLRPATSPQKSRRPSDKPPLRY